MNPSSYNQQPSVPSGAGSYPGMPAANGPVPPAPGYPPVGTMAPAGYANQAAPGVPTGMPAPYAQPPGAPNPAAAQVQTRVNPNSTQNTLLIAEIRDGIVIMNDGSFRSVLMLKSINFDLMSPQEREAVEYSYQGFLNSLYFPVQIFVRSQKVDLRPYIEKLDKIRSEHDNMLLALLMEDYIAYIDNLSLQTNIMDKKFYLVIPYFNTVDTQHPIEASKGIFKGLFGAFKTRQDQHVVINEADLEKAKAELRNRVQSVLAGLMQCGVQGLPLDTQELIELYYDTYNPDTATRQELKNFDDLSAPIITKGEGYAAQPNLDRELQ